MRKLINLFAILVLFASTSMAQDIKLELYQGEKAEAKDLKTADEQQGAKLVQTGTATDWNYGKIEKASTGVRFFKFTNTGSAPLVISAAKGSCGCTVPSYPKEPIMPGEAGYIKVKYDTKRVGAFTKYVTLTTNATSNTTTRLKITGTVEAEAAPTPAKEKSMFN
ncbi:MULTISPECIES: DUF1573 domain-containing protein [unclassified Aureispira]|uniref:DUF1573 domain-containing protein n=1 Tax=unclassified Aureispira TaxID=2649989 RepID=UPI0006967118|nr:MULTISPECIES: DUF1573 domain-containing protein [unclassified Aureispira]WMX16409.1 DUF1573 domain-containing protein [Aureispira sp. CCB-E]